MKSRLRVLIVGINYAPESSGNAPYTTGLAEGLAAAGHDVQVITGYPHYPEWQLKPGYSGWTCSDAIKGVKITRVRHFIPRKPSLVSRLHMELSFGIRVVLRRWGNPDVVLVVSPALFSSALAVMRARASFRRPAVGAWIQDIYSLGVVETGEGNEQTGKLMAKFEATVLRSADGVVVIHDRFRQYVVDTLGVPATTTRVIRNWTHLPPSPVFDREQMRERLGWLKDDVVVLHAGNMGKKQGLENVVKAAKVAGKRNSRVRFVLMGAGNQRQKLEALASNIEHIDFLDPLPGNEFPKALTAADVLLVNELPGVKEMAVPSKLTSYFNSGRPVIAATDDGSVTASEIAVAGGGIRVDAGDPEALVRQAEELAANPELAATLAAQGLQFRNDILSESGAIAKYDGFIKSLASSRCPK